MHIVIFVVVLLSVCKTTLKTDTPKSVEIKRNRY